MDLAACRHYVAGAMELLLILSALLSAVTGALTSPFGPEAGPRQETAVESVSSVGAIVEAVIVAKAPAALRPLDTQQRTKPQPLPTASPVPAAPVETDRLIE